MAREARSGVGRAEAGAPARRTARRFAIAGVVAVILVGGTVAATYTPLFAARHITVRGSLARAEVLSLAEVNARSNVFHLDVRAVERRLERDPRIRDATVRTDVPDRVTIEVVTRDPVGVVGSPASFVGADGVVIGPAARHPVLPTLVSSDGGPLDDEGRSVGAATAAALGPALRAAVDAVVVAPAAVEVRLVAGFTASFGAPSELAAKADSLAALLRWAGEEGVTVLSADLSVPGSPTAVLDRDQGAVSVP